MESFGVETAELPDAKVTVVVVDEDRKPVENADVSLVFLDRTTFKTNLTHGKTDSRGLFTAEGGCNISGIGSDVRKDGYYRGAASIPNFTNIDESLNQWEPWDKTYTTVLRPIGKPIALYAQKIDMEIPALDKPCGFDLEAGDWVTPYGKGEKSDFIFTLHQDKRGLQNYDILGGLTFSNALDGLQEAPMSDVGTNSIFKWERQAPEGNYQLKFQLQNSWHGNKGVTRSFKIPGREWEGYFFHVRTVEQNGQIVSARYGKIRGGIEIFPHDPNPVIVFTYYYNPTPNDRNLEWDPGKDLFRDSPLLETPQEP